MEEDLFEEEENNNKKKKASKENFDEISDEDKDVESASDDDEEWIPLGDDDLGITPIPDDESDAFEMEDEETDLDIESQMETGASLDGEPPEDNDTVGFADFEDDEVEAPPWNEVVEIPPLRETRPPKKTKVFVITGLLVLVVLFIIGFYVILQYRQSSMNKMVEPVEERSLFGPSTGKIEIKDDENIPLENQKPMEMNSSPVISGKPETSVGVGDPYAFVPVARDGDDGDTLTFFVANQPIWTVFDLSTGALTGTPQSDHVGDYENIMILASDGKATVSLPSFRITVIGDTVEAPEEEETQPPPLITEPELEKEQEQPQEVKAEAPKEEKTQPPPVIAEPALQKEQEQPREVKAEAPKEIELDPYALPDLIDLIKQSKFQDAAFEYREIVRRVPKAYSIKLEVDCIENSVHVAYGKGNYDRRMFILPKAINGKDCFVVFLGLYQTQQEAIQALSSIPDFFANQATKPKLVIVERYL